MALLTLPPSSAAGEKLWVVDNRAPEDGDGSSERPLNRLKDAEALSSPGDTIYVRHGDGSTTGLDRGILLQDGQRLVGEGVELLIDGAVVAPAGRPPVITSAAGDTITLAHRAAVQGVALLESGGNAVLGVDVESVAIARVEIVDTKANGDGIRFEGVDGAIVQDVLIAGTSGDGIDVSASANVQIRSTRVDDAGDEDGEHGIRLVELEGEVEIVSSAVEGFATDGVHVESSGRALSLVIAASAIGGNAHSSVGEDGLKVRARGDGAVRLTVRDTTFRDLASDGIDAGVEGVTRAQLEVTVEESDFIGGSESDNAISVRSAGAGDVELLVSSNRLADSNGSAIVLQANDRSTFRGEVRSNRIDGSLHGRGIDLLSDDGAEMRVALRANTVRDQDAEGIFAAAQNTSRLDLILTQNAIGIPADRWGGGFARVSISARQEAELCLLASGNVAEDDPSGRGGRSSWRLSQRDGSTFRIEGLPERGGARRLLEAKNEVAPIIAEPETSFVGAPTGGCRVPRSETSP